MKITIEALKGSRSGQWKMSIINKVYCLFAFCMFQSSVGFCQDFYLKDLRVFTQAEDTTTRKMRLEEIPESSFILKIYSGKDTINNMHEYKYNAKVPYSLYFKYKDFSILVPNIAQYIFDKYLFLTIEYNSMSSPNSFGIFVTKNHGDSLAGVYGIIKSNTSKYHSIVFDSVSINE